MANTPTVDRTRSYAIEVHGSQRYGTRPYSFHLDAVAELLAPFGEQAQIIGYLHDVVEDTAITLEEIENEFGSFVASNVALVSDEPGDTRKVRKAKTYEKLAQVSGPTTMALVVKAADRLANVRACIAGRNQRLWKTYKDEHPAFHDAAFRPGLCDPFWLEMNELLENNNPVS